MRMNLHVHVPWWYLTSNYDYTLERIEVADVGVELYISAEEMDRTSPARLERFLLPMVKREIPFTIHAPFMDLSPGSADPWIRKASIDRWLQLVPLIELVAPKVVVVHPGYNRCFYGEHVQDWQERASEALNVFIDSFSFNVKVAVENVFDKSPQVLVGLLEKTDHPRVGCCFDVGHYNVFGREPLIEWLEALGGWIFEFHIHDNKGKNDDHHALGSGTAPVRECIEWANEHLDPSTVFTIEAHTLEDLVKSLRYLDTLR